MTIREFVRRQLFTYVGVVVLVYFAGLLLTRVLRPGSIPSVLAMVALCIVTLFIIDRLAGIPCRSCGKPLGFVLFAAAVGLRKQRCPHCKLDVDEQIPGGGT
jgi:hypothetical protein